MAKRLTKKTIRDQHSNIDDPFKEIAQGLISMEEIWEEEPVDIETFICDKKFLNLKWDGYVGCRPKVLEAAKELVKPQVREAVLLWGKGSGKDFLSSVLHLYGIYRCLCMYSPQTYYGLSPGSAIYFINVARNEQQAKNVFFKEFIGHLENCAWFEGKYSEPGTQQVTFLKNIIALSGNSQAFGWLGYNTIQWVGDELAFFLEKDSDESSESKAKECWEAAFGSCISRFKEHYKMIAITTPRFDDDFVMHKFYELMHQMQEDGTAFAMQAATWEMHPNMTIDDFKNSLARDYRRTMRDFGAQPMGVIETFWGDPDFVDKNPCEICKNCPLYANRELNEDPYACWDYEDCRANPYQGNGKFREWFSAEPDSDYYIHLDLSKNKDKTSIAMTHVVDWLDVELDPFEAQELTRKNKDNDKMTAEEKLDEEDRFEERPVIKVDFIAWIDPVAKRDPLLLKNSEIYYDGILKYIIYWLQDHGFNIVLVTVDSYQSHMFKQSLEDQDIQTELLSLDRTDEVPVQAKKCFVENRVEYPYDRIFAKEARHLKYIQGKRVDHPTGKGKDIIDSVFGSVYNCETEEAGQGTFEIFDLTEIED